MRLPDQKSRHRLSEMQRRVLERKRRVLEMQPTLSESRRRMCRRRRRVSETRARVSDMRRRMFGRLGRISKMRHRIPGDATAGFRDAAFQVGDGTKQIEAATKIWAEPEIRLRTRELPSFQILWMGSGLWIVLRTGCLCEAKQSMTIYRLRIRILRLHRPPSRLLVLI